MAQHGYVRRSRDAVQEWQTYGAKWVRSNTHGAMVTFIVHGNPAAAEHVRHKMVAFIVQGSPTAVKHIWHKMVTCVEWRANVSFIGSAGVGHQCT